MNHLVRYTHMLQKCGAALLGLCVLLIGLFSPICSAEQLKEVDLDPPFISNFGEPNLAAFAERMAKAKKSEQVRIVQFGDSHTAADIFSGTLRLLLQKRFGNGGIGFIPAYPVKGIRSDLVSLTAEEEPLVSEEPPVEKPNAAAEKPNVSAEKSKEPEPIWQLLSSRSQKHDRFPLGGYLLDLKGHPGLVKIAPYKNSPIEHTQRRYDFSVLFYAPQKNQVTINQNSLDLSADGAAWQWSSPVPALQFPIEIQIPATQELLLGGHFLSHSDGRGVILSTFGINGAIVSFWDRWHRSWIETLRATQPDMFIIAYGTNEAFSETIRLDEYRLELRNKIRLLRKEFPQAVILMVGPPDSIKHHQKKVPIDCAQPYTQRLEAIIEIQETIAQQEKTLFWNWRNAMGGACSIQEWRDNGRARNDLVHLTKEGYQRSAELLYTDLVQLFKP